MRTEHGTIDCSGSLTLVKKSEKADCAGASGTGSLMCGGGRSLSLEWQAATCSSGLARGTFSNGRPVVVAYGVSSMAEAENWVPGFTRDSAVASAPVKEADGKPETKPGTKPEDGQKEPGTLQGYGSGFFVTDNGLLITNHHVVEKADYVTVQDQFTRKIYRAEILALDKHNDLAVLKINAATKALPLGSGASVRKGDEVIALGYPAIQVQGMEQKATFGRVNSLTGMGGDARAFQTDASIHGARFVGDDGKVVYEWYTRRWATNFFTGIRYEAYCSTRVTVDEDEIVVSFSWDGNDCR